ncbi:MAG: hydantoinase/oxoprolinase family protein, partial [Armatimonadota bacterium]
LMLRQTDPKRPVETILSGPAASIVGARALTGLQDAVVVDMGGTTTDIAVILGGEPGVNPSGAVVGGVRTSVRAAEIRTCGLGGDSHVWIKNDEVMVGPRRAVPLAYLAHEYPEVLDQLHELGSADVSSLVQPCDFLVLVREDALPRSLSSVETRIVTALRDGPKSQWHLAKMDCAQHPALLCSSRLEACGAVRRSSLTPTDILHAQGELRLWHVEASLAAVRLYARRLGVTPEEVCQRVRERVRTTASAEVLARLMPELEHHGRTGALTCPALRNSLSKDASLVKWSVHLRLPLIAIGAPAAAWLGPVANTLGTDLVVPPHAEVANAVGAVSGTVVFRESARIGLNIDGYYVVHSPVARSLHPSLESAKERAVQDVEALLRRRILSDGIKGVDFRITVAAYDRYAEVGDGQRLLVETQVSGTAIGRPSFT